MRTGLLALASIVLAIATPAAAPAQSRSSAAFEKMKSLAGDWRARLEDGSIVDIGYEVTANGSALLERIGAPGEAMVSIYHQDGDRLLMTHYCSVGNQPRMSATVPAGAVKTLTFTFLDVSNLASASASYMSGLTISFKDANHVTAVWTNHEGGKDVPMTFELERKK